MTSIELLKENVMIEQTRRIQAALDVACRYGGFDGEHHKIWVIDQMVRELTGVSYDTVIRGFCNGVAGSGTYGWETGIAP